MNKKYIKYIPKTLQEDFIDNRVIPFVGAGFSKNGILPSNQKMLDWDELGKSISTYISNYSYSNAIDALSLFESEFSRTKLIELLARELKVNQIKPGNAHRSLCDVYFDTICTTNFDFLIEQTLNEKSIPFSTIVSEDRLPISTHEKTKLIKLHGDFNHPEKMVVTEWDYDTFIEKNKILSTYVSNLFITKTLLLVGYSFDDNDIRTLWGLIGSRLGRLSTPAYAILVDASPIEISRFERRNIKVINIRGSKSNYPEILAEFFSEIKELIDENIPKQIIFTSEKATEEQKMPSEDNRLCFVSAPFQRISFLKELLYPILLNNGISPVTLDEVIMPGELLTRKIDTLISQSSMAIVDLSGNNANVMWELGNAMSKDKHVILIVDSEQSGKVPSNLSGIFYLIYSVSGDNSAFLQSLNQHLRKLRDFKENFGDNDNPQRLLVKKEYTAAVILAFRLLETTLSNKFKDYTSGPTLSVLDKLNTNNEYNRSLLFKIKEYRKVRNALVHTNTSISKKEANDIVKNIQELCNAINNGEIIIL